MEDMWRIAAHHLTPDDGDAMVAKLVAVEEACWERCATDQRAFTLADLLSEAASDLGVDVAEAAFEEAATQYLDSWTPHIRHDPHAAETLRALRVGLHSNTHWPPRSTSASLSATASTG